MKTLAKILTVLSFTSAIAVTTAFGQPIFTFDEYGNGNLNGNPVPSSIVPDPSGGVTAPVLVYNLPFPVIAGDVLLIEPGSTNQISDVVRFWNPTGGNQSEIIFYSDFSANDPADAPADTGLPTQLINPLYLAEIGPEGNNGATYIASGGPGTIPGALIQYNIISDGVVPEPSTFALAVLGSGLFLFTLKRRIHLA